MTTPDLDQHLALVPSPKLALVPVQPPPPARTLELALVPTPGGFLPGGRVADRHEWPRIKLARAPGTARTAHTQVTICRRRGGRGEWRG